MNKSQIINILTLTKAFLDVVNYSSYIRHFDFYHDHITHWQPLTNPTNPPKQKEQQ